MGVAPPAAHSMQMVGPWGRYLPQWLRAPCNGSGPARSTQYADGRTLGYLPQWLRAPGNGSGPAICQHTHTHTEDLTHHNVCFRDPIRYTCQLCIPNTHMHAGRYTYTLYISQNRVATRRGKVRETEIFSRSGNCQGIL